MKIHPLIQMTQLKDVHENVPGYILFIIDHQYFVADVAYRIITTRVRD